MKKSIIFAALALCAVFALCGTAAASEYMITADNASSMRGWMASDLSGTFYITENITLSSWSPVGASSTPFTGTIAGYPAGTQRTITGMTVSAGSYAGMFAYVSGSFTAQDIKFVDCTVTSSGGNVGLLYGRGVGGNEFTISNVDAYNCTVKSTASSGGYYVGGIAGLGAYTSSTASPASATFATCTVKNCTVSAGDKYAGGICGRVLSGCIGTFTSCKVTGTSVLAANQYAAGICPAIGA